MTSTRPIAAGLALLAVLLGSAACGGSSKPNNAAACQKLQADVKPLSTLGDTSNLSQLQSSLNAVAGKLKADAKQGDSTLQSGVNQLVTDLDQLIADAKAKNLTAAKADITKLESAGGTLSQACPDASSSS